MIGIYKITSPSRKVYIGQSIDIERRFKHYRHLKCKEQPRLYRSFVKYGVEEHRFEVIWQCFECYLTKWERYFQDMYKSTGRTGLNCILVKTDEFSGGHSEESKNKISNGLKGRTFSAEHRAKIGEANRRRIITEEHRKNLGNVNRGRKQSEEWIKNSSKARLGQKRSEETKQKMSESAKNRITDEWKQNISNKLKGRVITEEWRLKLSIAAKNRKNKNN